MTLSEYSHLKQQVVLSVCSSERHNNLLSSLKDLFRDEINSPRRFETIATIGHLLNVLEIRDALSEDNVAPLKQIAQRLSNYNELMKNIKQYETTHVPREYRNCYGVQYVPYPSNTGLNANIPNNKPPGSICPVKQQRVVRTIVEEIGNAWRDLARNLNIRECVINEIDNNYKSLPRKALRLMELYFQQKADPSNWYFELCDALNTTRRKDLTKSIQKIVMMNIN